MPRADTAVVLLGHGSRVQSANQGLHEVAAQVAAKLDAMPMEVAFLQLAEPGLEDAVARCVAAGARHIVVVPFFLFPGAHVRKDIPETLDQLATRHPGVELLLADVLGGHSKLAEVAAERALEVMT